MALNQVNQRGLVLLGCGKMGSAMLQGWLSQGVSPDAVYILDPKPSEWVSSLTQKGVTLNAELPENPVICILAVKPQMMGEALPRLQAFGNSDTIFLSIAAGTPIKTFENVFGDKSLIVRAMPNTPAAIGKGITALIGNAQIDDNAMALAETLLSAVGETVRLENEDQMDAVTAVSGSGPAYVFHMIETMAAAGEAEGLSKELAMQLALATVEGAGALANQSDESASQLRINVTSPAGTTAAALEVLMSEENGFPTLLKKAIKAAADRSRELAS